MAEFDFPTPPVLAVGLQASDSGYGCAMQAVSWITGDLSLSDFPGCADKALTRIVQMLNDGICFGMHCSERHTTGPRVICPEHSIELVNLGLATVGTRLDDPRNAAAAYVAMIDHAERSLGLARDHAVCFRDWVNSPKWPAWALGARIANKLIADPATAIERAHEVIRVFKEAAGIPLDTAPSREEVVSGLDAMREHAVACGVPVA